MTHLLNIQSLKSSLKLGTLSALFLATPLFINNVEAQDVKKKEKTEVVSPSSLKTPIPIDENVKVGTLSNGMKYYIRKNSMPANRVELRLAVNAGSILEDNDQQGLAHFTEHMAFNGTTNFKKNDLIDNLEKMGVRFGADLNAYTSFDETVYMLPLPTDSVGYVDKGLLILKDWASGVLFEGEEIDKERGVVIEEWRRGKGASERMRTKYWQTLLKDSRYAERLPIGKKEILESFEHETIRRFYEKWYRPDLMAIVAVGDIDVEEMEKKIKETFESIPKRKKVVERPSFKVPMNKETLAKVVSDKEATRTQLMLFYKQPKKQIENYTDLNRSYVNELITTMLNARMEETQKQANPPFLYSFAFYGDMIGRDLDAFQLYAGLREDNIENGIETITNEVERVKKFGFTESELERAKKQTLKRYEKAFKEQDKTESNRIVMNYVYNFLENQPIPSPKFEYEFLQKVLPAINLNLVNTTAKSWMTEENRVAILTAVEKEEVKLPTEEEVISIWDNASKRDLKPYEEKEIASALIADTNIPKKGSIEKTTQNEKLGYTELTLSNGAKVILKKTDFKNDEILVSAYSMGGHSLYEDKDYVAISNISSIIAQSGIGEFSPSDMDKFMSDKAVRISPYISEHSEGFQGSTSPEDLETALQLMHLYFTNPRWDENAVASFVATRKGFYQNLDSNPNYYFYDQFSQLMSNGSIRSGFPKVEELESTDWKAAYKMYNERFSNAADFTFFFIGNFDEEKMKNLLETYIATLPSSENTEEFKDLGIRSPKGMVEKIYKKGSEPQSNVRLAFAGEMKEYEAKDEVALNAIAGLLRFKLIEKLREEKGGVYSAGAYTSVDKYPVPNYNVMITFPCAPENVDDLIAASIEEVEKLRSGDIDAGDLEKFKEAEKRKNEVEQTQNKYWLSTLKGIYYYKETPESIEKNKSLLKDLTVKDVEKAAKKYLDTKAYIKAVLVPETVVEEDKGE
ncbi:M16 family metallopeptidase [Bernardetia sp.]|uniref:M16 family metallopeptidase n=1 Tax=Bernardetia sp. TaxID=1937974 RepID=UPI0025C3996F|nr:M16 family metallopeptidase [Bernardetia sp.]